MKSVRAQVRNGQVVPVAESVDMTADELARFEAELDESAAQIERGEYVDARTFALRLLAKS